MNSTDIGQAHTTETRHSYRVTRNAQSHRLAATKLLVLFVPCNLLKIKCTV